MRCTLAFMICLGLPALVAAQGPPSRPARGPNAAPSLSTQPLPVVSTGGHTAPITRVLFTPDSASIITVSLDKTARVWDADSGDQLRVLRVPSMAGRYGELHSAALSADGKRLALGAFGVGGPDHPLRIGPIYVIHFPSGTMERVLRRHVGTVQALSFSRDGKRLASAGDDRLIRVWDTATGKVTHKLEGHAAAVVDLAFCPNDPDRLVSVSKDQTCRLWSLANKAGKEVHDYKKDQDPKNHDKQFQRVAWSPNGKRFAASGSGMLVLVWNADGKPAHPVSLQRLYNRCRGLSFTVDSRRILVTADERYYTHVAFYDVASGQRTRQVVHKNHFHAHEMDQPQGPNAMAPDGQRFAVADDPNHHTFVWDTVGRPNLPPPRLRLGKVNRRITWVGWDRDQERRADWTVLWRTQALTQDFKPWQLMPKKFFDQAFSVARLSLGPVTTKEPGWQAFFAGPKGRTHLRQEEHRNEMQIWRDGKPTGLKLFLPGKPPIVVSTLVGEDRAVLATRDGLYPFDVKTGKLNLLDLKTPKGEKKIGAYLDTGGAVQALAPSPMGPGGKRYFAAIADDHVVRIYDPADPHPLLFVTASGPNWLAWTRSGYYACSPFGERLLGWQVNNGPDELASYYPAAHFRKSLYRPDIVERVLDYGTVFAARAAADKERGQDSQDFNVAGVLPPHVRLTAPGQPVLAVAVPALVVKATAEAVGGRPITGMRLLMDGRPYPGPDSYRRFAPPLAAAPVAWKVAVPPGTHTFAVQAESAVSKAVTAAVEVTFNAPRGIKPVNPAKPIPKVLPGLYVLAIGISEYPGALKLGYAHADAKDLSAALARHSKPLFKAPQLMLLTDKKATRQAIVNGLAWLKGKMTVNDVAIVSFAGHGVRDKKGNFFLLPFDGKVADLAKTGIAGDKLKEALADMPGRIIVLLDACHSGAVGAGQRRRGGPADDLVRDLVTEDYGVIVMCSSTGGQVSEEHAKHGHGLFTKAILEGLAGAADYNKDGRIDLKELDLWVTDWVERESDGRQNPVLDGPPYRRFAVAAPGKK